MKNNKGVRYSGTEFKRQQYDRLLKGFGGAENKDTAADFQEGTEKRDIADSDSLSGLMDQENEEVSIKDKKKKPIRKKKRVIKQAFLEAISVQNILNVIGVAVLGYCITVVLGIQGDYAVFKSQLTSMSEKYESLSDRNSQKQIDSAILLRQIQSDIADLAKKVDVLSK